MHNGRTPQETWSLSTATWAKITVRELGGCASKYGPAGLIICHVHSNGQHNNALHKSTLLSRRVLTVATPTCVNLSCKFWRVALGEAGVDPLCRCVYV